jgi:hypothetical protein
MKGNLDDLLNFHQSLSAENSFPLSDIVLQVSSFRLSTSQMILAFGTSELKSSLIVNTNAHRILPDTDNNVTAIPRHRHFTQTARLEC